MIDHDPTHTYRAAIIGAGSGGLTLAIGLAGFGHEVALIESGPIGGDCTNVGCIPSKSLLHAASVGASDPFRTVRAKRDGLSSREDAELVEHDLIHLVRGRARLTDSTDPHVVTVVGIDGTITSVRAENVVICTGSKPLQFPIDGLDTSRVLTNESLFELDAAPTKMVMIGGGAISLEMATAFRDLGSDVEIVELEDRLLPTEDPLVSATIRRALEEQGVTVHTGTSIARFDSATAHLANGTTIPDVDKVLFAVGRRPQLDDLGLDAPGVKSTTDGIVADSFGRTNIDRIYAVGDVTGNTLTTHGANSIGRRTIRAIALPYLPKLGEPRAQPNAVFSRPQVASVGLSVETVHALPRSGRRRYVVQIADLDRGLTDDVDHGIAIVDAERFTGKILRAAIVGPAAAEIIGMFTMAIDHGIGLRKIFSTVHPYPAYAQLVGQVADDFARDTFSRLPIEWWGMARGRIGRRPTSVPGPAVTGQRPDAGRGGHSAHRTRSSARPSRMRPAVASCPRRWRPSGSVAVAVGAGRAWRHAVVVARGWSRRLAWVVPAGVGAATRTRGGAVPVRAADSRPADRGRRGRPGS